MTLLQDALAAPQVGVLDLVLKQWIEDRLSDLRAGYMLFEEYYKGDHRAMLTDRLQKFINPDLEFRDNFCSVVVDVMVERLEVIGFDGSDEAFNQYAWDIWKSN